MLAVVVVAVLVEWMDTAAVWLSDTVFVVVLVAAVLTDYCSSSSKSTSGSSVTEYYSPAVYDIAVVVLCSISNGVIP